MPSSSSSSDAVKRALSAPTTISVEEEGTAGKRQRTTPADVSCPELDAMRRVEPNQNMWGAVTVRIWALRIAITHERTKPNSEKCAMDAAKRAWMSFLDSDDYKRKCDHASVRQRMYKQPVSKSNLSSFTLDKDQA